MEAAALALARGQDLALEEAQAQPEGPGGPAPEPTPIPLPKTGFTPALGRHVAAILDDIDSAVMRLKFSVAEAV
jgi:hypothetical protein